MKQKLLNSLRLQLCTLVACLLCAFNGQAWGETKISSLIFTAKCNGSGTANDGASWTITSDASESTFDNTKGIHYGTNSSAVGNITLTTSSISGTITKVVVNASTASGVTATVGVTVAGNQFGGDAKSISSTAADYTFEGSAQGTIVVQVKKPSKATKALYVKSIVVTYEEGGSQTETVATPTFSPAAGTYTSAQNVTISTTTSDATIYYTTDGNAPTTESSVYNRPITVNETTTIKAIAVKDGMNNSGVATATYTILNLDHAGTAEDPYSVADAIALLTADPNSHEDVYVSGIISQVDSYNSTYHSITYWISDDGTTNNQFEVYSGKGLNGADFSAQTDLTVGSAVVVKGTIKKFNSTFEFDYSSQIVSMEAVTHPVINADETLMLEHDATSGSIEYSITNPTDDVNLTATTTAGWISNITVGADAVTFTTTANEGNEDREATITLSYTGAEDKTVTVTQKHFVAEYATLPFEFYGGNADIANTAGLTQSGLGTDYNSAPKLKFDGTGDYVILKINERPGTLTFDIKGNPGGDPAVWAGTFTVQTSEDGVTFTDLQSYTELTSTVQSEEFKNLGENVRYIKWIYTNKSSGNVGLGSITLAQYSEAPAESPTVNIGTLTNVEIHSMWIGDNDLTDIEDGSEVEPETEVFVKFTVAEGYTLTSVTVLDANNDEVTVTENSGNYSFYMPNSSVTINATATSSVTPSTGNKYVKVTSTSDLTSGQYLIVYEEGSVAFNGGLETLDAASNTIGVTISNNKIAANSTTTAAEFTIDVTEGTIKSASGLYIGRTADSNGMNSSATEAYTNTISIGADGNAVIVSSGGAYLRYNSNSDQKRFRYFKSSSYTGQKAIQLYKKVEATPDYTRAKPTSSVYGTLCLPYDATITGGTLYNIASASFTDPNTPSTLQSITLVEVGTKAEAGKGYIIKFSADEMTATFTSTNEVSTPIANNGLIGNPTTTGQTVAAGASNFVLQAGELRYCNTVAAKNGEYRAYIDASQIENQEVPVGVKSINLFLNGVDAIDGINSVIEDAEIYNIAGQRMNKLQRGVNIVNGKKVLVK